MIRADLAGLHLGCVSSGACINRGTLTHFVTPYTAVTFGSVSKMKMRRYAVEH